MWSKDLQKYHFGFFLQILNTDDFCWKNIFSHFLRKSRKKILFMSYWSYLSRPIDVIFLFNTCKKRTGHFLQKRATQHISTYNIHVFYEYYRFFGRGQLGPVLRIYFSKTVVQCEPWQQNLIRQHGDSGAMQAWVGTGLKVGFIAAWNSAGLQRLRIPWLPQPAKMQLVPPTQ